jgi:hypothetical protein
MRSNKVTLTNSLNGCNTQVGPVLVAVVVAELIIDELLKHIEKRLGPTYKAALNILYRELMVRENTHTSTGTGLLHRLTWPS